MNAFYKMFAGLLNVILYRQILLAVYNNSEMLQVSSSGESLTMYASISGLIFILMLPSVANEVSSQVKNGEFIYKLLKPFSFWQYYFSKTIGTTIFLVIYVVIPSIVVLFILDANVFKVTLQTITLFLLSVISAIMVNFCLKFIIVLFSFVLVEIWGIELIFNALVLLASGSLVPLWMYPDEIRKFIGYFPFRCIFDIPLQIYTHQIYGTEMLSALMYQVIWLIVLLILNMIFLKVLNKRINLAGG